MAPLVSYLVHIVDRPAPARVKILHIHPLPASLHNRNNPRLRNPAHPGTILASPPATQRFPKAPAPCA